MTSGTRLPTWRERENNKRRERRRRAIAAKIFSGLRLYGNYKLPKHCDNNEVLKAVCAEAGWTIDEDGTTYRQGAKPLPEVLHHHHHHRMEVCASSASEVASPSSSAAAYPNDGTSLIPWLKGLSSATDGRVSAGSMSLPPLQVGRSSSAPVTPPLSSPTGRGVPVKPDWDVLSKVHHHLHHPFLAARRTPDEFAEACGANSSKWANGVRVRTNPLGPTVKSSSRNGDQLTTFSHPWRHPMQKSISTPVSPVSSRMRGSFELATLSGADVTQGLGSLWELDGRGAPGATGPVKRKLPADDLELTLGTASVRSP